MTHPLRNILLICADQWRPDQFDAPNSMTPHLDALAQEGVSFDRHYAQVLPCSPSRASLYTGLYATRHNVLNNSTALEASFRTLGHYLRDGGYVPTLFGYTDTILKPDHPEAQPDNGSKYSVLPGVEVGCHQPDDNPREWLEHLAGKGHDISSLAAVYAPDRSSANATGGVTGCPARYAAEDSDTAFLVDRFLDWKSGRPRGWCAMINFLRPHRPTIAPAPYNAMVDPTTLRAPVRADTPQGDADAHPYMETLIRTGDAGRKMHQDLTGRLADVAEVDWRSVRATHLALMAEIDANLGRIFAELKDCGEWENTLVIFSSDHGEMLFDHHICQQASWHEQCTHLPLIIRDPVGQSPDMAGQRVARLTESIDIIPTLLDLLGLDVPAVLDGRSLAPFLRADPQQDWRQEVFWQFQYGGAVDDAYLDRFGITRDDCVMSVIRSASLKYAMFPGAPSVLVDLEKDPEELQNLSGHPDYAAAEAAMHKKLLAHLAQS